MLLDCKSYWERPDARRALLFLLVVSAAILRFADLGRQPLWLDEATDASFAARNFWNCVFAEHVHPPLYRTLLHFFVNVFGDSAFTLRFLPAVFGILAVPAVALLSRQIFPQAELTAAALVATSPFLIYYSQENRNYSLFILLALLSTSAFLRFKQTGRGLALYGALSILLLYTHYLSVFILLAHELVYWRSPHQRIRDWLVSRGIILAAFVPWLVWMVEHYRSESRTFISPGSLVPIALVRFLMGYGVMAADSSRLTESLLVRLLAEAPVILPSLCLLGWLLWRGVRSVRFQAEARTLLAATVLVPWAALILVAPWAQLVHERYLAFQAPFILLLAAVGLCTLRRRARQFAHLAFVLVIGFSLHAYYGAPGSLWGYRFLYAKENWPGAAAFVQQAQADTVIIAPGFLSLALDRYPLGSSREIAMPANSSALPELSGARRIALVISRSGAAQARLRATLDSAYTRTAEREFSSQNGIQVIIYDTTPLPQVKFMNPHAPWE